MVLTQPKTQQKHEQPHHTIRKKEDLECMYYSVFEENGKEHVSVEDLKLPRA